MLTAAIGCVYCVDMATTPALDPTALIAQAAASKAQWPQYDGHFDGYVAVRCVRDVKSRGDVICRKGQIVIMNPKSGEPAERQWEGLTGMPKYLAGKILATFFLPDNLGGTDSVLRVDYFDMTGVELTDRKTGDVL